MANRLRAASGGGRGALALGAAALGLWSTLFGGLAFGRARPLSFRSAPALHPPPLTVRSSPHGQAAGLLFFAPFSSNAEPPVGQAGAEIAAADGEPVWFHPAPPGEEITDFTVQRYRGKPVLTWWQGTIAVPPHHPNLPVGSPEPGARFYVYNNRYQPLFSVAAADGWTADLHEFLITPRNTALLIAAKVVETDLAPYGGPAKGRVEDFAIQEVSLPSGRLLASWDMVEHIPLAASETSPSGTAIWDPYHLNSIQEVSPHELVLSARNTWAIYAISWPAGKVLWQLGGKGETVTPTPAATFYWQHDARLLGPNRLTLFDDGCCSFTAHGLGRPEQQAHGLLLELQFSRHRAVMLRSYAHKPPLYVPSQGNVQLLAGGNVFVGWGQLPYFSEYNRRGQLVFEAVLPEPDNSYRAYRLPWSGFPATPPSLALVRKRGRTFAFVSDNGATDVVSYALLIGPTKRQLRRVRVLPKRGFQTALMVPPKARYVAVVALGRNGKPLGRSKTALLSANRH